MTSSSAAEGASASVHQLVLEAPRADWHLQKKKWSAEPSSSGFISRLVASVEGEGWSGPAGTAPWK